MAPPDLGKIAAAARFKITLVDRPGSVQTNILAGDFALRRADPDFIPLTVMNRVLGGGPSARLFLNLREKHGYTYGAYSYFTSDIYPGAWRATTEVRNAVTDGSMHELMEEFKRIRTEPVPEVGTGRGSPVHRRRFRALARTARHLARFLDDCELFPPASGLLGPLSRRDRESKPRSRGAGGEEIRRSRPLADCLRGRRQADQGNS